MPFQDGLLGVGLSAARLLLLPRLPPLLLAASVDPAGRDPLGLGREDQERGGAGRATGRAQREGGGHVVGNTLRGAAGREAAVQGAQAGQAVSRINWLKAAASLS